MEPNITVNDAAEDVYMMLSVIECMIDGKGGLDVVDATAMALLLCTIRSKLAPFIDPVIAKDYC